LFVLSYLLALVEGACTGTCVIANAYLRFGTGSETSIQTSGNLAQPWYYQSGSWYKLTYSSNPLDMAVGTGTGSSLWHGTTVQDVSNLSPSNSVTNYDAYTQPTSSTGYGTVVTQRTFTVNSASLTVQNTYVLGQTASFIRITTRVSNPSSSTVSNMHIFVGTRDDWVGTSDSPTKTRGSINSSGQFVAASSPSSRSPVLQVTSGNHGVVFYSVDSAADTSTNSCCSFSNAYNTAPSSSSVQMTNDGSYSLVLPVGNVPANAYASITWYYAAGAISDFSTIISQVNTQAQQDVICSSNTPTANGYSVASGSTANGSTRVVTCTTGYSGSPPVLTCDAGQWTALTGCNPVNCGAPSWAGYSWSGSATTYGTVRSGSCATGYTGTISISITCSVSGAWTLSNGASAPSGCTIVSCGDPTPVSGYTIGTGGVTYGSSRSCTCSTGYTGTAASLTCQASGSWSAASGCTIRNCGNPTAATGYVLASGGTTYGSTRVVSCAAGYGGAPPAISCTSGGSWESQTGCTYGCGAPTSVFPGYTFSGSSSTPGAVLTATGCATGYNGASSSTITCATGSGGVNAWSTPTGCSPNDCGEPTIRGYTVATGENYFPTRRTTTCATGWSGSPTAIQCNADSSAASGASWSIPTGCTINDCGSPGATEGYTVATPVSTTYESTTDIICAEGYWGPSNDLDYFGSIFCQADRRWTTPVNCTMVDCGQPVFPGYIYNLTDTTMWQAVVQHDSCEEAGYFIVNSSTSECLADGTWSAPSGCQPVECGEPVMELGYDAGDGLTYFGGGGVEYSCSSGYNGPAGTLTCQENGNWSPLSGCNKDSSANSMLYFSAAFTTQTTILASALVTFFCLF